jgi:hypothetical protein
MLMQAEFGSAEQLKIRHDRRRTGTPPDETEQEKYLQQLLSSARAAEVEVQLEEAERLYLAALDFANATFNTNSHQVGSALFHVGAFYAVHDRPCSASTFFAQMRSAMRWY